MLGTLETTFYGQKTFTWSGDQKIGLKRLNFLRGTLTNGTKGVSERDNVRKNFFQTAL